MTSNPNDHDHGSSPRPEPELHSQPQPRPEPELHSQPQPDSQDRVAESLRAEFERQRDAVPPPDWSMLRAGTKTAAAARRRRPGGASGRHRGGAADRRPRGALIGVAMALLIVAIPAVMLGLFRGGLVQSSGTSAGEAAPASGASTQLLDGSTSEPANQVAGPREPVGVPAPQAEIPRDAASLPVRPDGDTQAEAGTAGIASWGVQQLADGITSSGWDTIVIIDGSAVERTTANPPTYTVRGPETALRGTADYPLHASTQTAYTATELLTLKTLPARVLLLLDSSTHPQQQRIVGMFRLQGDVATQVWPRRTRVPATFTLSDLRTAIAATDGEKPPQNLTIPFSLYTHCGIDGFAFGGRWYARDGGTLSDQRARELTWPDLARGTMAFDGDHATFTDAAGRRETFTIAEPPTRRGCL